MSKLLANKEYHEWLGIIKENIKKSQIKASVVVNSEMLRLYWNLGMEITEKQKEAKWGSGFLTQLSSDLQNAFPGISGFSKRNLELIRQWIQFYNSQKNDFTKHLVSQTQNSIAPITKQAVSQLQKNETNSTNGFFYIPWGHHILIVRKIKNIEEAVYYIQETIANNWSRAVLQMQIESNLYARHGKSVNNFALTLPKAESDLAQQLLKDPYNFEFLTLEKQLKETELEKQLVAHITQFLLELGKGFAYLGRQFPIKVGSKEYRTDLLFYHIHLRAYIIIELKTKEFEPEFVGKLGFYITAINELIKTPHDKPTIGILLCKEKDNFEVEFALKDVNKPIGVSAYTYKELPEEIKMALPDMDDLKNELNKLEN